MPVRFGRFQTEFQFVSLLTYDSTCKGQMYFSLFWDVGWRHAHIIYSDIIVFVVSISLSISTIWFITTTTTLGFILIILSCCVNVVWQL